MQTKKYLIYVLFYRCYSVGVIDCYAFVFQNLSYFSFSECYMTHLTAHMSIVKEHGEKE